MGGVPKYDSRRFKAVFRFLLEPIAVVNRDYGIYGDYSILEEVFCARNLRSLHGSCRQRVIDLLLWCGFGDRWDRYRSSERPDLFDVWLSFPKQVWTCSAFWKFFVDERSAGFRAHVRNSTEILHFEPKVIVSTPQCRKLFIELLNRYAVIRDIVITRFPRELFELARMRERKILRAFLGLERGRLLKLRDADENCLLLHVAGCRGCISGVIRDLTAAGFDPHRRNAHHQTACDRYYVTCRVRSKQRVCIWNHYSYSDVQGRVTTCD
jgi:hypothetical protein